MDAMLLNCIVRSSVSVVVCDYVHVMNFHIIIIIII